MARKTTRKSPRKTATKRSPARRRPAAPKAKSRRSSKRKGSKIDTKSLLYTLGAAAVLGYIEAKGIDKKIPQLPMLGTAGTMSAALLAWGHFQKAPWAIEFAKGTASIAAYRMGVQFAGNNPAGVQGDFADVSAMPASAAMPIVGVDPRLLADAAEALEGIAGDDDDLAGDDDDLAGDDDDLSGDDDDLAGDDDDLSGDDDE
jgi:hypothetical protein